jgi:hypothetical protein
MQTFLHSAIPALIGSGVVLSFVHICRAIWGRPTALFKTVRQDDIPRQFLKDYYRTLSSWIPTCLMSLGFVLGAGLSSYFRPSLAAVGFAWCAPLIAGLTVGLCIWFALRLENRAIRAGFHRATLKNEESEQAGSSNGG